MTALKGKTALKTLLIWARTPYYYFHLDNNLSFSCITGESY